MYYLYNFLAVMLLIFFVLPYFIWRYFREKGFPRRFRQSMGFIRDDEIAAVAHQNCIWIHGASVGEIVATSPLVKEIRKAMPDAKILVSAVTTGGYNMAHQIIPEADAIIYFPLDMPFVSESLSSASCRVSSCLWKRSCGRISCVPSSAAAFPS